MSSINKVEIFYLFYSIEPDYKVMIPPKDGFSFIFEPVPGSQEIPGCQSSDIFIRCFGWLSRLKG